MQGGRIPTKVATVALHGVEVVPVTVQVRVASGLPAFIVVGLADKAVSEARERVRSALAALGMGLPPKRIVVNLAPAGLPKEGSHYDLPIALGLLSALEVIEPELLNDYVSLGELGLDGAIGAVRGVLPAAMWASGSNRSLICPRQNGAEATVSGLDSIIAVDHLSGLLAHLVEGAPVIEPSKPAARVIDREVPDMSAIRGQYAAKRALEVAAAGGHNVMMVGPPGGGKSMLAERLPGIMPPLSTAESLEVMLIRSVAGMEIDGEGFSKRPFRSPHHTASVPALVGGGPKSLPGEISLAHGGVLFLDEFPEFSRQALEALRQPLETGKVSIARAQHRVTYNSSFQLIAAMNPCRCGYFRDPDRQCRRVPLCAERYREKISGPMLDRIDIFCDVGEVAVGDLTSRRDDGESSATIAKRVAKARLIQRERYDSDNSGIECNARLNGEDIEKRALLTDDARRLLAGAAEKMRLSARSWFRLIRVARTLADLDESEEIVRPNIAEALSYRRIRV